MADYTLKTGEHLTLTGTATDDAGAAVDISTGYTFTATIKKRLAELDADAFVHINSITDAGRFLAVAEAVTATILSSVESNTADISGYAYDLWAANDANGTEYLVDCGSITFTDSVSDEK